MRFFFFKQKTAYEIKECDWSSDVCSSDLLTNLPFLRFDWDQDGNYNDVAHPAVNVNFQSYREIGRASCRERV